MTYISDVDKSSPLLGCPVRRGGGPLHLRTFLLQHKNRKLKTHLQITCMHGLQREKMLFCTHFNRCLPNQHECMFLLPGSQSLLHLAWVMLSCSQQRLWLSFPSVRAWLSPLSPENKLCSGCTVICFAKKNTHKKWRVLFKIQNRLACSCGVI